jgi:predicted NBD/HSP70 family sugar kinase
LEEKTMNARSRKNAKKILVVAISGASIKVLALGQGEPVEIPSGPNMPPDKMVKRVKSITKEWNYDEVSLGYPGPVVHGRPLCEPHNLGPGWIGFDFREAFGCPVKIINDAAMQAIGGYEGGRMLFLGLDTGLGSALIVDGLLQPMEVAHLPYKGGKSYEYYVGPRGLKRFGRKKWRKHVAAVIEELKQTLGAEYVMLGGENAAKMKDLPDGARLGSDQHVLVGGRRLWTNGERSNSA